MEDQGTRASRTQKHSEAGYGRPVDRGVWTAKTVKRPRQQPAHPQYAKYWAPLTRKRHIPPHPAQPWHTNDWAPRTRKRHQQEHRPQRPTESSDPTQHAKGRPGDCPGPRKGATTRRNVTQGGDTPSFPSDPPALLSDWAKFFSRPSANQKFSPVPSVQVSFISFGGGVGALEGAEWTMYDARHGLSAAVDCGNRRLVLGAPKASMNTFWGGSKMVGRMFP